LVSSWAAVADDDGSATHNNAETEVHSKQKEELNVEAL
jgi:hypothetical protein